MIYLDCPSGMAGDMFAGALIGLGADFRKIRKALKPMASISMRYTTVSGIRAVRLCVKYDPKSRNYSDLINSVRKLRLKPRTERMALRILRILGEAESSIHGMPLQKVHLHEAVDCAVDSVAAAVALEDMGFLSEEFACSIVSSGYLAPATKRIITDYGIPVKFVSDRELLTPTGAAIIAALGCEYETMRYSGAGVGAGSMKLPWPNVVKAARVFPKAVLETNIDDCTPEQVSYLMSSLMDAGALDVHVLPCMMKKGRVGFLVRVLTDKPMEHALRIISETRTLGVRVMPVGSRVELTRQVKTRKVKVAGIKETVRVKFSAVGFKPEYDDVAAIAKRRGLTFREVSERIGCALKGSRA